MDIQMLGTGSAFAKQCYNTNALVYANGKTLMIDCGHTAPRSLMQLGKTFNDIDALLVSHIHADHIGGIEEFAYLSKFAHNRKPLLFAPEPLAQQLWDNSLKGGLLQEQFQTLDDYFDVRPIPVGVETELFPGLAVEPIQTPHIPGKTSFSFFINRFFFYTADMTFQPELLQKLAARGCTKIFHDCQLQPPGVVHTTLDELLTLPEQLQDIIWLMHYEDHKPQFEGRTGRMRFVEQHRLYKL